MIEILIGGVVVSSGAVTAQTGSGVTTLEFGLDYAGAYPSSLSFRFSDGSIESGRSVTFEKIRIDGWAVDAAHLSSSALSYGQSSNVNTAAIPHLFGGAEPVASDLGTPTINGTALAQTIVGTAGNDIIDGKAGNDSIKGNAGDDAITGGADNDSISGGLGNDFLFGDAGNDSLLGNENDDLIYGGIGNDTIDGGDGKDALNGGDGKDILKGGTGDDIIIGGKDADTIYGGTGSDTAIWNVSSSGFVIYRDNAAYITVLDTNDKTANGYGADKVYNDVEYIVFNDITINLATTPFVTQGIGWGTSATQYGTALANSLTGTAGMDTIYGGDGNDKILGRHGNDTLYGESGVDNISGEGGNDSLYGGDGNDTLNGGDGNDLLSGGKGNDAMYGGTGSDTVVINASSAGFVIYRDNAAYITVLDTNDTSVNGNGSDKIFNDIEFIVFNDITFDLSSTTFLLKGAGVGTATALYGTALNNALYGTAGSDTIYGGDGNDTLFGRQGNDRLYGENGNDVIYGEAGDDIMDGGAGTDTVNYSLSYGVAVNLGIAGAQDTGGSGYDTLTSIENISGSNYNDVLTGDGGNNIINGASGDDIIEGGGGNDTLNGGAGTNTVAYAGASSGVTVNLGVFTAQNTVGAGTDSISNFQNLTGSAFNDTLTGNAGNNAINGGGGNDRLTGSNGNDTLDGGADTDTVVYTGSLYNYSYDFSDPDLVVITDDLGSLGTDTIRNVELFEFSEGTYTRAGLITALSTQPSVQFHFDWGTGSYDFDSNSNGVNTFTATTLGYTGAAGDQFTITRSFSSVTLTYLNTDAPDGLTVTGSGGFDNLVVEGTVTGLSATIDMGDGDDIVTITAGGNFTIHGDAGDDDINAGAGDDILAGGAGDDALDGAGGSDTADYSAAAAGISASLLSGSASDDGDGGTDTYTSIENITGSAFDDIIEGNSADNAMDGGAGTDTITYANAASAVAVNLDLITAQDTLGAGNDTLSGFENLIGSAFSDTLAGDSGNNVITGGTGADTIDAGDGDDTINLSSGDFAAGETLIGNDGTDNLVMLNAATLDLTAGTLVAIENLTGSSGNDTVTMLAAHAAGMFAAIDLAGGADILNVIGRGDITGAAVATISGAETGNITGTAASDTFTLTGAQFDALIVGSGTIDMAGGTDTLSLSTTSADLNTLGATEALIQGIEAISFAAASSGITLNLGGQTEAFTITGGTGSDTITAGGGNDTINLANGDFGAGESINGGGGTDSILLTNATTIDFTAGTITAIETLTGSAGNDTVTMSALALTALTTFNLGTGTNVLNVVAAGNIAALALPTLTNVTTGNLTGTAGTDTVTLAGAQLDAILIGTGTVNLGAGSGDTINLTTTSADLNTLGGTDASITGVEAISAATAATGVTLSLSGQAEAFTITGSGFNDIITGGTAADTIAAGGGNDTINLANGAFAAGESIDGGAGTDSIVLTNATTIDFTTGTVSAVETLTGSTGNDTVTMSAALFGALTTLNLGTGTNVLNVVAAGNISALGTPTVSNVTIGNLTGTAGTDTITLNGAQLDALLVGTGTINLGAGTGDTINLTSTSADLNTLGATDASIVGVEAISAATAAAGVTITLSAQTETFTITGSGFNDTITGGTAADTIAAGGGNDTINLANGAFAAGESIDGGAGTDSIVLTNATTIDFTTGTIIGIETLTGSTGNDTVTISAAALVTLSTVNLGTGTNVLNVVAAGDISASTVPTFTSVTTGNLTGTAGTDTITMTGAQLDAILIGTGTINLGAGTGDTINLTTTSADLNTLGATDASIQGVEAISAATAAAGVTITLSAQTETFTITGSGFNDTITGGTAADTIAAGGGNDTINLANGAFAAGESIDGGAGTDAIVLTNATIVDFTTGTINGIETLTGSTGNDTVTMSAALFSALTTLNLGTGTNVLNVLAAGNISALTSPTISNVTTGNLTGTGGDDVITLTGAQLNAILIGSGTINLGAGTGDTINLTSTSADLNTLGGTNASIVGVETISAAGAAAGVSITLSSQTEGFTIIGSGFNDTLTGGTGADIISGGAGNDTISGNGGIDQIRGGAGADNLTGGGASDILLYDTDTVGVTVNLSSNTASGGDAQGDTITTFENVYGGSGNDTLTGTNNANILYGNDGNDVISGGGGADTIRGGAGSDTLTGGNGGDTFVFDSFTGTDTITDFKTNQNDTLDISNLLTGFAPGVSDIDNFCQFQVSGGNTTVRVDVDGTANGVNFVSIASLTGVTTLVVQTLYDNGQIIA